ncbi:MAG: hypothetical protein IFK94_13520 [Acidobacteria bacterium]|uniref:Uncharacterized protein n=1 Tax=Candidatus Polarisedimenticola svalbardensis TaxID=2886004 RepID=A0A8J7C3H3_9BACT|nr:hypothetical protein [Candidatus Polarisedimenticola svalbardensis]
MKKLTCLATVLTTALILASFPALSSEDDRLQRALDWPQVDLGAYETVFVEDIRVTADRPNRERTA